MRPYVRPLVIVPLLVVGLLFYMKGYDAAGRIWLAQPALGIPAAGPVNMPPLSQQIADELFNRWARRVQEREIRQTQRALARICPQIKAGALRAPTRADEHAARRECRAFGYR